MRQIIFLFFVFASVASVATDMKLPLKFHRQEHELSCEAAALKMVLNFQGENVSETEILSKMPLDPLPKQNGVWGDPDEGFVGNIDGVMGVTGYGIHAPGLAKVSQNWKRTEIIDGGNVDVLVKHLLEGRPVIVWGYHKSKTKLRWKTKTGRKIVGLKGQHTRVVYGFKGDPKTPSGFFVMDPLSGGKFWLTEDFLENWESLGKTGIVIFNQ